MRRLDAWWTQFGPLRTDFNNLGMRLHAERFAEKRYRVFRSSVRKKLELPGPRCTLGGPAVRKPTMRSRCRGGQVPQPFWVCVDGIGDQVSASRSPNRTTPDTVVLQDFRLASISMMISTSSPIEPKNAVIPKSERFKVVRAEKPAEFCLSNGF
jgi:hypothetical protein